MPPVTAPTNLDPLVDLLAGINQRKLVKVPLRKNSFVNGAQGASCGTAWAPLGTGFFTNGSPGPGFQGSDMGFDGGLQLYAGYSSAGDYAAARRIIFWGGTLGIVYQRDNDELIGTNDLGFTCMIDGVCFPVTRDAKPRYFNNVHTKQDWDPNLIVAQDLGPGPHTLDIVLLADPASGATRYLHVQGLLLEESAGYRRSRDYFAPFLPAAVPTSATAISLNPVSNAGTSANHEYRALRKILLTNEAVSGTRVTLQAGSGNHIIKAVDLSAAGLAGDTAEIDLGGPTPIDSTWKIKASQAGAFMALIASM